MPCPFCMIAGGIAPSPEPAVLTSPIGSAYPILSTQTVVAFLDIAPVSRGHLLLCPRRHSAKITDLTPSESAAIGFWLPVLCKAAMKALYGDRGEEGSWNVLQANGAEAGQTVPHVHFHVIPRLGVPGSPVGESEMTDAERKNLILGEGPRVKLEDGEGRELSALFQGEVKRGIEVLKNQGELLVFGEENREYWGKVGDMGLKL